MKEKRKIVNQRDKRRAGISAMAGVWGVGFNHCGQIGPDFMEEDSSPQESRPGGSRIVETDEAGSPATCKLWKPNTCWRLKQVQNLRTRTKSLPRLSRVASFLFVASHNLACTHPLLLCGGITGANELARIQRVGSERIVCWRRFFRRSRTVCDNVP